MASTKTAAAIDVRIDDVGSILKFRIIFLFWREFCWVLQVRVTSVVDAEFPYRALFADTVSDSQIPVSGDGMAQTD